MSNNLVTIESDYEYVIGNVMGNVLNAQLGFSSGEWSRHDLQIIAKELEHTGKTFAEQQGLGEGDSYSDFYHDVSVNGTPIAIRKKAKRTGTLIKSIHAVVDEDGKTIHFFNNANLGRGFYAGHIEYGHHARNGRFVQARPFMRPALYAVSESSQGRLTGTLKHYLEMMLAGGNFFGGAIPMGTPLDSKGKTRVFFNQTPRGRGGWSKINYTSRGLLNSSRNAGRHWGKLKENNSLLSVNRKTGVGYKTFYGNRLGNSRENRGLTRSTSLLGDYKKGNKVTFAPPKQSSSSNYQKSSFVKSMEEKREYVRNTGKVYSSGNQKSSSPSVDPIRAKYGTQSDYGGDIKAFADKHYDGRVRAAAQTWKGMEK